jgi:hypothetical protein
MISPRSTNPNQENENIRTTIPTPKPENSFSGWGPRVRY